MEKRLYIGCRIRSEEIFRRKETLCTSPSLVRLSLNIEHVLPDIWIIFAGNFIQFIHSYCQ